MKEQRENKTNCGSKMRADLKALVEHFHNINKVVKEYLFLHIVGASRYVQLLKIVLITIFKNQQQKKLKQTLLLLLLFI